jgi:hypothetical protein
MPLRVASSRPVQTPGSSHIWIAGMRARGICGRTRAPSARVRADANLAQIWDRDGSGRTRRSGSVAPLGGRMRRLGPVGCARTRCVGPLEMALMNCLLVGPTLAFINNSNLLTSSLTSHMTQLTDTEHALKGLLIVLVVANSCVTILVLHHISLRKNLPCP